RGSNLKNNFTPHSVCGVDRVDNINSKVVPHSVCGVKKYLYSFWLWFCVVITGLNIWALFFSAERGPQLGLYGGIIIAGILYFIFIIRNKKIAFKKIALTYGAALIILIIIGFLSWNTRPIERLKTIVDFSDASSKSRLITWGVAWEGIKDRPILGWGTGNFIIAEGYHYNPTRLASVNINFDKIHNKVLEVGINSGFLGMISYLSIFALVVYILFKNRKEHEIYSSIFIGLFSAYFIQNLTAFDSPASYLALFLALAFINSNFEYFATNKIRLREESRILKLKSSFLFIVYIIIIILFIQGVWQPWQANKTLNKAIGLSIKDKTQVSNIYSFYNQSFSYNAMPYEARINLAKFVVDNFVPQNSSEQGEHSIYNELGYEKLVYLAHLAESELEKENKTHPNNILVKRFLAEIYNIQTNKDTKYILLAERELQEAIQISPNNPMLYYSLGRNYYRQFKEKKAETAFQKYLELHPNPPKELVDFIESIKIK
ncbi:MAG: O-antigen ligase family protein, partial [Patescibacteria group bacterium]